MPKPSVLAEFTNWVAGYVRDHPDASAPEVSKAAVDAWYARGPDAVRELLECLAQRAVYELVLDVFAATRGVTKGLESRARGTGSIVREILAHQDEAVEKLRARFAIWREHAGDRHYILTEMTKPQLLQAATERRTRAGTELGIALFLERLAHRLKDGEKVSDRWSPAEMERLLRECMRREAVG
jgi:hypothetical protein